MVNKFRQIQKICLKAPDTAEAIGRAKAYEAVGGESLKSYSEGVIDGKALGKKELSDEIISKVYPEALREE